jgi:hypothetical protein
MLLASVTGGLKIVRPIEEGAWLHSILWLAKTSERLGPKLEPYSFIAKVLKYKSRCN